MAYSLVQNACHTSSTETTISEIAFQSRCMFAQVLSFIGTYYSLFCGIVVFIGGCCVLDELYYQLNNKPLFMGNACVSLSRLALISFFENKVQGLIVFVQKHLGPNIMVGWRQTRLSVCIYF